jgi:UDP-N-acetyl-D-galactosamine dehydrogenase
MALHVALRVVKLMIKRNIQPAGSRALVLGLTFKENCPDVRNTKVADVVAELKAYGVEVDVHDPWVDANEAQHEYGIELTSKPATGTYDAIIIAVAHREFVALGSKGIHAYGRPNHVTFDIKHVLGKDEVDGRL